MTKICRKCKIERSLSDFHKDAKMKDGHKNICKFCINKNVNKVKKRKIDKNLKTAIYLAIRHNKSGGRWEKIVGYTLKELKQHLEKQFNDKMNWKNFGYYWWIDRIIPISAFDYSKTKNNEFKKAWDLKNTRPLYKIECIKKRNKIIPSLIIKYKLFDILPVGIINQELLKCFEKNEIKKNSLDEMIYNFVFKFENKDMLDIDLYKKILYNSNIWNAKEVMDNMIEQIKIFKDYDNETLDFNYKPYLKKLKGDIE